MIIRSKGAMQILDEEHRLLYRLAQAYYIDGQTQQQIARRFDLSRPKVSRLLQRARDTGVVSIALVPPASGLADQERALENRYGLEEVVLVPVSDPADADLVSQELGLVAAQCLLRSVREGTVVGLAWGRTILEMVNALPVQPVSDTTVVQLNGGLGPVGALDHSTDLVRRAAQRLGSRLRLLPAPGIVSSVEVARALRADYQISEVLRLAARSDVAVVGLGTPSPDSVLLCSGNILTPDDLRALQAAGAVGDILLRYIDREGASVPLELNERIIGLTLAQLADIPRVIAVAGGTAKREIIHAALRTGLLHVLVTDEETGRELVA